MATASPSPTLRPQAAPPAAGAPQRLGELLIARGLISAADLEAGLRLQGEIGGLLGLLLVRLGSLSETQLLQALSEQLELPVFTSDLLPSLEAAHGAMTASGASLGWWAEHGAVLWSAPFTDAEPEAEREGEPVLRLRCAAAHPLDLALQEMLARLGVGEGDLFLAQRAAVTALHDDLLRGRAAGPRAGGPLDAATLRELAQETPVIDFVNAFFSEALARRASDVHIEPFEDQFFVRMRIDGLLHTVRTAPRTSFDAVCSRIKLLSGMDIGERRLPQDGRQTIRVSGQEVDLRVSTLPASWGESVVLRLLGKTSRLPQLSELGVDDAQADQLLNLVSKPNGVVLITGPTGSGKTTTIYRLLTHLNDGERKIVTVEDPVELDLPGVVQVHVRSDIGLSFAAGLRSILRQDPDVIMVGEIRDAETARIAIQSALTGHLVISTVHTNSALAAISRLTDLSVEGYLLADVLRGLVGQRLVRRLCPHCARPSTAEEAAAHEQFARDAMRGVPRATWAGRAEWREPSGCAQCNRSGFLGRVGVYEIAEATAEVARGVREGAAEEAYEAMLAPHGFRTLLQDGVVKARRGLTTLSEVLRVASLSAREADASEAA